MGGERFFAYAKVRPPVQEPDRLQPPASQCDPEKSRRTRSARRTDSGTVPCRWALAAFTLRRPQGTSRYSTALRMRRITSTRRVDQRGRCGDHRCRSGLSPRAASTSASSASTDHSAHRSTTDFAVAPDRFAGRPVAERGDNVDAAGNCQLAGGEHRLPQAPEWTVAASFEPAWDLGDAKTDRSYRPGKCVSKQFCWRRNY